MLHTFFCQSIIAGSEHQGGFITMKKYFSILLLWLTVFSGCSDINHSNNPEAIISFEDSVVEGLCVKHFDLNGDGRLSYLEAAAVRNNDLKVFNEAPIKRFNEFKFFYGITCLDNDYGFRGCPLTVMSFPENLHDFSNLESFCHPEKLYFYQKEVPDGIWALIWCLQGNDRNPTTIIYVPKSCLSDYKAEFAKGGIYNTTYPENLIKGF